MLIAGEEPVDMLNIFLLHGDHLTQLLLLPLSLKTTGWAERFVNRFTSLVQTNMSRWLLRRFLKSLNAFDIQMVGDIVQ